ncbi:MAG: hypothetical protein IPH58_00155 [Sphingobacteriales bacterium]|nr:hypothetical protein [Sphingobacteriales bacterium]
MATFTFLLSGNPNAQSLSVAYQKQQKNIPLFYNKSLPKANNNYQRYYNEGEQRWLRLRRGGIILTSVGAACIGAGAALIHAGNEGNYDGDSKVSLLGLLGISGGVTAIGGGVTMWAIGNNRLKKIKNKFSFDATPKSAHLVFRF